MLRLRTAVLAPLIVACCLASSCSVVNPGQPTPIFGYRLIDDRTIAVLALGGGGSEVFVQSVVETSSSVVVAVRERAAQGAGGLVGQDVWLTINLNSPLGDRTVIDADGNTRVPLSTLTPAPSPS